MCRDISGSKRRDLLHMSVFALDALTVSPCCSMLFATVGPGGLPGRYMLWGPSQLLGGQTELMGPLPVGSSMSGDEGNQGCPSHLAQAPALVLLEQNQGHRFMPLQINLFPAINGDGWAAGQIIPLAVPCARPC